MRPQEEVDLVRALAAQGKNHCEVARLSGVPRSTVLRWLQGDAPDFEARRVGQLRSDRSGCLVCRGNPEGLPRNSYVYLLGLYLGDGYIAKAPKGVYRLCVSCDNKYPGLMQLCHDAMGATLPKKVGRAQREGCTDVQAYSKHWPCLFPQHGPGMKHTRKIELVRWQQDLVDQDPRPLLRGLIHSDGCRVLNRASGTDYPPYPRYHFNNVSADIMRIFGEACDAIGVEQRYNNRNSISIARRPSVAKLDEFIGPKY